MSVETFGNPSPPAKPLYGGVYPRPYTDGPGTCRSGDRRRGHDRRKPQTNNGRTRTGFDDWFGSGLDRIVAGHQLVGSRNNPLIPGPAEA